MILVICILSNSGLKQGDEVYGQASAVFSGGSGAFAELALVDKDRIAHKPRTLTHIEAAGLPTVGVSAWQGLIENIELSKDKKILIHGGAGGIGSIAGSAGQKKRQKNTPNLTTKIKVYYISESNFLDLMLKLPSVRMEGSYCYPYY